MALLRTLQNSGFAYSPLGLRVLVVDDESAILFAYRKMFEAKGFIVDTCENITEAIDLICMDSYLAVISDLRLVGTDNLDGISLLKTIKEVQPETKVIIITGNDSDKHRQIAQHWGVVSLFEKPVSPSVIVDVLDKLRTTLTQSPG
jgi:DNA-binding NtrC family response regulator